MPAAAIAAVAASKQGAEVLEQRKLQWQEAFRSLYMAVQCNACHCLYFISPQVGLWKKHLHVCSRLITQSFI